MERFVVFTLGVDRPGIVAAVTGALFEQGCNLADCSMTILAGHFAMVLVVDSPSGATGVETALEEPVRTFDLGTAVRRIDDRSIDVVGDPYVLSVYGADHPGMVARITRLLADNGVNVTDLETRVIGAPQEPVYAMLFEVTFPAGLDAAKLRADLAAVGAEVGVDTSLHAADADVL
ncbi:MAG TPA: ACT domain-containing protein [Acidimicrobiia bacterium]|jgi:glycine cleavage system transcriptional repressor|nr:ACT domain-containing protein [Acidimicrobiia bacterium]